MEDITVKSAAELLRVSEKTVYRWIRQGVVPAIKLQGQYRFNRRELEGWARHKRIGAFDASVSPREEAQVFLHRAVQLGGIHYKIEGGCPAEIYPRVAGLFPFSPRLAPTFAQTLTETLLDREALVSTGIGHGIALPHPRHSRDWGLDAPAAGVFFLERPVDFHAIDGEPVFVLFAILCATVKSHLKLLSQVSHLVNKPEVREMLRGQPTRTQLMEAIGNVFPPAD